SRTPAAEIATQTGFRACSEGQTRPAFGRRPGVGSTFIGRTYWERASPQVRHWRSVGNSNCDFRKEGGKRPVDSTFGSTFVSGLALRISAFTGSQEARGHTTHCPKRTNHVFPSTSVDARCRDSRHVA